MHGSKHVHLCKMKTYGLGTNGCAPLLVKSTSLWFIAMPGAPGIRRDDFGDHTSLFDRITAISDQAQSSGLGVIDRSAISANVALQFVPAPS